MENEVIFQIELPSLPTLSVPAPHATMLLCNHGIDLKLAKDRDVWPPHRDAVLFW